MDYAGGGTVRFKTSGTERGLFLADGTFEVTKTGTNALSQVVMTDGNMVQIVVGGSNSNIFWDNAGALRFSSEARATMDNRTGWAQDNEMIIRSNSGVEINRGVSFGKDAAEIDDYGLKQNTIQLQTSSNYAGTVDDDTGYLIYSTGTASYANPELHFAHATAQGVYDTVAPVITLSGTEGLILGNSYTGTADKWLAVTSGNQVIEVDAPDLSNQNELDTLLIAASGTAGTGDLYHNQTLTITGGTDITATRSGTNVTIAYSGVGGSYNWFYYENGSQRQTLNNGDIFRLAEGTGIDLTWAASPGDGETTIAIDMEPIYDNIYNGIQNGTHLGVTATHDDANNELDLKATGLYWGTGLVALATTNGLSMSDGLDMNSHEIDAVGAIDGTGIDINSVGTLTLEGSGSVDIRDGGNSQILVNSPNIDFQGNSLIDIDDLTATGSQIRFSGITSGTPNADVQIETDGDLVTVSSDRRLKKNISKISNPIEIVDQLKGVAFDWKKGNLKNQYGFIAQDVEKVLPSIVYTNSNDGYKGLRYDNIIPIMVEAMKEQQDKIESLESRIKKLEKMIKK